MKNCVGLRRFELAWKTRWLEWVENELRETAELAAQKKKIRHTQGRVL